MIKRERILRAAKTEKVSFDFDGVLDTKTGEALLKRKQTEGYPVYIISARREGSEEVLRFAREHGVPRDRVYFTNGEDKWKTIKRLGIKKHYDNNAEQVDKINKFTDCEAVLVEWTD